MFSEKTKHIGIHLFLIAFLLLKASGLHAFTHAHEHDAHDDLQSCFICHVSSRDDAAPMISTNSDIDFITFNIHHFVETTNFYESIVSEKMCVSELFNKPPPFITVF